MKENNILIAEFLGWEKTSVSQLKYKATQPYYISVEEVDFDFRIIDEVDIFETFSDEMKFDTDWNWLMLVVEKILKTDEYHELYVDYSSSIVTEGGLKLSYNIKEVHTQCIDFIKWYNNLK